MLWRRVNRGLSAGRVQSPSIRLIVQRERERIAFVSAGYWDIELVTATSPSFTAALVAVGDSRVATGKDFDANGVLRDAATAKTVALDEQRARALADGLADAPFTVRSVEERPFRSSPKAPFMTSTLQQEGGRRLRLSASQVMRLAQGLYERGFITYMRTDNVTLSSEAVTEVRDTITKEYGKQYLSPTPRQYASKVKNAQEAHEAIRPTTPFRSPNQVQGELNAQELALYRLVWQRTLASQMADATGTTVSVRLGAVSTFESTDCVFAASGTTITFAGHRAVYVEARADDDGDNGDDEALLPPLTNGDPVPVDSLTPNGHATTPPARYTEASLVKRLEELGIGRPSTWASIIQTVQDRGYVWKKGQALIPTWTAFAVVSLMEQHFDNLVDYEFTAKIEEDLDAIAAGQSQKDEWLTRFYFGDDDTLPGLKRLVEENLDEIDAATINTFPLGTDPDGNLVVVKPGKYGPYVKRGDDTAGVPDDLPPDELTMDKALELLGGAEERRADRRARRLPGVRQERPVRALRAVGIARSAAARPRQAEDGEPVQDDGARTDHGRRGGGAVAAAPHRRPRPIRLPGDRRQQRPLRPLRRQGQGLPFARLRGAVAHDHARPGDGHLPAAQGLQARWTQHGGVRPAARVRNRPGQPTTGHGQGRPLRRLRDRRRDERVDRQGRSDRGDAAGTGLRAAGDPPRGGRGQGWYDRQAGAPQEGVAEAEAEEGRGQEAVAARTVSPHLPDRLALITSADDWGIR